jgi:hypothetical protein
MKRKKKKGRLIEERKINGSAGLYEALLRIFTSCLHKNGRKKKPS